MMHPFFFRHVFLFFVIVERLLYFQGAWTYRLEEPTTCGLHQGLMIKTRWSNNKGVLYNTNIWNTDVCLSPLSLKCLLKPHSRQWRGTWFDVCDEVHTSQNESSK